MDSMPNAIIRNAFVPINEHVSQNVHVSLDKFFKTI